MDLQKANTIMQNKFEIKDLDKKKNHLVFKNLKKLGLYEIFKKNKMILAGGAISSIMTNTYIRDLDMYFKDKKYIDILKSDLLEYNKKNKSPSLARITYQSNNAISCIIGIYEFQFITISEMIKPTAKEIIEQFDFSVCQCSYDFEQDNFILTDDCINDINKNQISYNLNSKHPISSLFRLYKYRNKGYGISTKETLKLALSIERLNLKTYGDIAKSLAGVSTVIYDDLVKLLKSEDYYNEPYKLENLVEIIDDYIEAKRIIEQLENPTCDIEFV